jgi:2-polyprenyl-6-methoxyphenol hydroxylase-like FAD-dependent oxidoreductase
MTDSKPLKVLVSGAGIAAGSFASCLLRGLPNTSLTIIERDPSPRLTGASIDIRSSAVDIIKWLDVEQEIRANTTKEEGMQLVRADGSEVATIMTTGRTDVQGPTSEYEIFRGKLAEILLRPALKTAKIVYGETVESYEEQEDGVLVTFTKSKKTERYDLLVATDGLRSKIRGQMLGTTPGEHIHDSGVFVSFFTIKQDLLEGSRLSKWFNDTNGRGIFLRPDPDPAGRTRGHFMNVVPPANKELKKRLNDAILEGNEAYMALTEELFADAGWMSKETLKGMRESDDFYCSLFTQVRSPKLSSKRVALIGDAGFATPGIGTSLAIIGGYILAGELLTSVTSAAASSGAAQHLEPALQRYETLMLPIVKGHQGGMDIAMQLFNPQTSWGLSIRNFVLGVVNKFRLDTLAMSVFGWSEKKVEMPEYAWPDGRSLKDVV